MKNPMYSVVIPTLNEEKYLPLLLASLAKQTKRDFEVVVVDGSSRDKTVAIAKSFIKQIPHLTIVESAVASLPLQRNLGARQTQGEWLVFIDADSILLPYFFERVNLYIETNKPKLLTTWCRPDSEVPGDAILASLLNLVYEAFIILKRAFPPGPLSLVTREAYELVHGYDEEHAYNEDVDFGIRLANHGIHLGILRESLFVWSLRRLRKHGALKVIQQYIISAMPLLLLNKSMKYMPGYVMGGQLYDKKKGVQRSMLREYRLKLKRLMKDFFS